MGKRKTQNENTLKEARKMKKKEINCSDEKRQYNKPLIRSNHPSTVRDRRARATFMVW